MRLYELSLRRPSGSPTYLHSIKGLYCPSTVWISDLCVATASSLEVRGGYAEKEEPCTGFDLARWRGPLSTDYVGVLMTLPCAVIAVNEVIGSYDSYPAPFT